MLTLIGAIVGGIIGYFAGCFFLLRVKAYNKKRKLRKHVRVQNLSKPHCGSSRREDGMFRRRNPRDLKNL